MKKLIAQLTPGSYERPSILYDRNRYSYLFELPVYEFHLPAMSTLGKRQTWFASLHAIGINALPLGFAVMTRYSVSYIKR